MAFSLQFMASQWPRHNGSRDTMHYWDIIVPIPLGFLFTKLLNTSLTFVYRINSIINIAKKRDRSSQSNSWTFIVLLYAITYQGGDCWIYLLCYFPLWIFGEDQFTSHYYFRHIAGFINSQLPKKQSVQCFISAISPFKGWPNLYTRLSINLSGAHTKLPLQINILFVRIRLCDAPAA